MRNSYFTLLIIGLLVAGLSLQASASNTSWKDFLTKVSPGYGGKLALEGETIYFPSVDGKYESDLGIVAYFSGYPVLVADYNRLYTLNSGLGAIRLTWDDQSDENSYKIYRSTDYSVFTKIATLDANVTSYDDLGLPDNKYYVYKVGAVSPDGDWNSTRTPGTTLDRSPPAIPSLSLTAQNNSNDRIDASWADVDDNSSYITFKDVNLMAYWRFEEGSGTSALDSGPSLRNALINNPSPVWGSGKIGGGMDFNGTNQYAYHSSLAQDLNLSKILTISFWMKPNSPVNYRVFISFGNATGFRFSPYNDASNNSVTVFDSGLGAGAEQRLRCPNCYAGKTDIWSHTVLTFDTANWYWYVDGVQKATGATGGTGLNSSSASFYMGGVSANSWSGALDEVMIFDRVFSAADANNLYQIGKRKFGLSRSTASGGVYVPVNGAFEDFSAGLPSGWTAYDTNTGTVTASGGVLNIAGSTSWTTTGFIYNTQLARNAGTTFEGDIAAIPAGAYMMMGFKNNSAGLNYTQGVHIIYFKGDEKTIRVFEDGAGGSIVGNWTAGTTYHWKIILKSQGARYYVNDKLIYDSDYSTEGNLKPYIVHYSTTAANYDNLKITPATTALSLSDNNNGLGLDANSPTTPASPTAGNATTSTIDVNWSASTDTGSTYYYTLDAFDDFGNESNLLTTNNAGFETGGTTNWSVYWSADGAVTNSVAHAGNYALRFTGATSGGAYHDNMDVLIEGEKYLVSAWAKSTAGATAKFGLWIHGIGDGGVEMTRVTPPIDWTYYSIVFTATSTLDARVHLDYDTGSGTIYVDDVKIQKIESTEVTTGIKQYMITDLNTGTKYIATSNTKQVTGLSPSTQHCFTILSTDNADNNSSASSQSCATTTSSNTAPTMTSIDLNETCAKSGTTIKVSVTGAGDAQSNDLNLFCATTSDVNAGIKNFCEGYAASADYSTLSCTGTGGLGVGFQNIYCTLYDGTTYSADFNVDSYTRDNSGPSGTINDMNYISKIGTLGTGDDQFDNPYGITTDGTYLYIADRDNDRIVKRNASDLSYVSQIGSNGTGDNQFSNPRGITTDGVYLYIADMNNDRIVKRNLDLSYVNQIGSNGTGDNYFLSPFDITTDGTYIYVADSGNDRIVKRNANDLSYVSQIGTEGIGDDQFSNPYGITTDGTYIYVTDSYNYRIVKRNASDLSYVSQIGTEGTGDDQFYNSYGITTDGTYIYVADSGNDRIVKRLATDLSYVSQIGTEGTGNNQFILPIGVATDGTYIYITDYENYRIVKRTANGFVSTNIAEVTANSITATSSTVTDSGCASTVQYYFEESVTSTNSGWQDSNSWQKTSLDVNTLYSFRVKTKDALGNESTFTDYNSIYTLANIPGTPDVNNAAITTIDVTIDTNSNPAATQFAIYDANTTKYVQANGSEDTSAAWQTNAQWSTKTVTGLNGSTQYCFKVKARNGDGAQTALSDANCATTLTANTAPTMTSIDLNESCAKQGTTIKVTVTGTTDAQSDDLNLFCATTSDVNAGIKNFCEGYAASADYSTLNCTGIAGTGDGNQNIYCTLWDGTVYSSDTNTTNYTRDNNAPTVPSFNNSTVTNTSVYVSTIAASDSGCGNTSINYYFEESTTATNSGWIDANYWIKTSLDANTLYSFRAKAKDALGNESSFTPYTSRFTKPNIPGPVILSNPTISTMDFTIDTNNNQPATTYRVYVFGPEKEVQADGSLGDSIVLQTASQWGTKTVTDLNANTYYNFWSAAYSGDCCDASSGWSLSSIKYTLSRNPSITSVSCSFSDCNVNFDLNSNPAGTQYYITEKSGNSGGTNSGWSTIVSPYSDTSLSTGTEYCYTIRAKNGDDVNTVESAQACATTLGTAAEISVSSLTYSSLKIDWEDADGETGYKLWRSTDDFNANYTLVTSPAANSITYTNTGLGVNTRHYYILGSTFAGTDLNSSSDYNSTLAKVPRFTTRTCYLDSCVFTVDLNANPTYTELAIYNSNTGSWLEDDNTLGGVSETWKTRADWGNPVRIEGLSQATNYCFSIKARNLEGEETILSAERCRATGRGITLSSTTHRYETKWYNAATVDMRTSGTRHHIYYYVSQNASETNDAVRASGTYDKDGLFSFTLSTSGTYYVHAIAETDQNVFLSADTFIVNFDNNAPAIDSLTITSWTGGVEGYTKSVIPPMYIDASDSGGSGLYRMSFSCDNNSWSVFRTFDANLNITGHRRFNITREAGCENVDGNKVVYVKVSDGAGNISEPALTNSFVLDRVKPTGTINLDDSAWTGGVVGYTNDQTPLILINSTDADLYTLGCTSASLGSYSAFVSSISDFDVRTGNGCTDAEGSKYVYTRLKDLAGNLSRVLRTARFRLDQTALTPLLYRPKNNYRYNYPDPELITRNTGTISLPQLCFVRIGTANPPSSPLLMLGADLISGRYCYFNNYTLTEDDTYYWDANVMDRAGNWSDYSAVRAFIKDITAPELPLAYFFDTDGIVPYWDAIDNTGTTLTFRLRELKTQCKWGISNVAFASMGNSCVVNKFDVSCSLGNYAQSTVSEQYNTIYYSCADDLGNAYDPIELDFGVDYTKPATSDNSVTTVQVFPYNVTITESDNATGNEDLETKYCIGSGCSPNIEIDDGESVLFDSMSASRGANYLKYYSVDLANNVQDTVAKTININRLPEWGNAPGFDSNATGTISCTADKTIGFDSNSTDPDSGQTLKLVVCSSNRADETGCLDQTLCESSLTSANPGCVYTQPRDSGIQVAYGFLIDSQGEIAEEYRETSYTCDSGAPEVTLVSPQDGAYINDNTPELIARPDMPVADCYLQVADDNAFTSIVNGLDDASMGSDCSLQLSAALSDGEYYWRVKATSLLGADGNYSVAFSFGVDTTDLQTSIVSVAADTNAPYWDTVNDSQTTIIVNGETGMQCRFGTEDADYNAMANDCSVDGSQAQCDLGSLSQALNYNYFVSCIDQFGVVQDEQTNLDVSFGVDWTAPVLGTPLVLSHESGNYVRVPTDFGSGAITENIALDGSTCEYSIDNSNWNDAAFDLLLEECFATNVTIPEASTNVYFRIRDLAENLGTSPQKTVIGDTSAPTGLDLNFTTVTNDSIGVEAFGASDAVGLASEPYWFRETTLPRESGYQASEYWTVNVLRPNTEYSFTVKARDIFENESAFITDKNKFTLANIPMAPLLANQTSSTFEITINDLNANPASTQYMIVQDVAAQTVELDGSISIDNPTWKAASGWGTVTLGSASGHERIPDSNYNIWLVARNNDLIETQEGPVATILTLAQTPGPLNISNATQTTIDANISSASNPAWTVFAIYDYNNGSFVQADGSLDTGKTWRTDLQWDTITVTGLTAGSQHCFAAKARNQDGFETNFGEMECITTFTAPTVTITSPTSGETIATNSVTVTYTGYDPDSSISTYWLKADSGAWVNNGTSLSYTFTGQSNGSHTYYVIATDSTDLNSATESVGITVSTGTSGSNCGNGSINSGEECDGSNLNGETCTTLGYVGGSLSCTSSCAFNTGGCTGTGEEICDGIDNDNDGLIDENLIRECGECGIQYCSSGSWGTCNEPSVCGSADLVVSAYSAPLKAVYGEPMQVAANIQNIGETTNNSFKVRLSENSGSFSEESTVNGLASNDAIGLLYTVAWNPLYAGTTRTFTIMADSENRISETNELNNTREFGVSFGTMEICGNLVDDDFDGIIDENCGLPNLKIIDVKIGKPVFVDKELVKVDFNVTIVTEYEDVDTEFAVSYFKNLLGQGNRVSLELIDSIRVGQSIKLMFVYQAPMGEVLRFEGNNNTLDRALFADITNFYVQVDSENNIDELLENDNIVIINIENLLPDLTFPAWEIPGAGFEGEAVSISVTLLNQGEAKTDTGTYKITVYVDNIAKATQNGVSLLPNQTKDLNFSLAGISRGGHSIRVKADSLNELAESNETNNEINASLEMLESSEEVYTYDRYVDREPIMAGVWNSITEPAEYTLDVPLLASQNDWLISIAGLASGKNFQINFLQVPMAIANYNLNVSKNGLVVAVRPFSVVDSTPNNVIELVNDRSIGWVLDARFLKLMHYERINQLAYVWWELFSEKP